MSLRQSDEAATLAAATDAAARDTAARDTAARDGVACDGVADNEATFDGTMIDKNTTDGAAVDGAARGAVTVDGAACGAVAVGGVASDAVTVDCEGSDAVAVDGVVSDETVANEPVTGKAVTDEAVIRLYGTADDSIVDGPGIRFSIFTQGCSHGCAGCHNPGAQSFEGGTESTVAELWERIRANRLLKGITLTGGEPFEQAEPLIQLARKARENGLTVWAYSGYRYEDLLAGVPDEAAAALLAQVDVLVDGPFVEKLKSLDLRWKGSANQRIIDVVESQRAGQIMELHL